MNVTPGYYIYVGSAFGPGGVSARVRRHCRDTKRLRWHIDYLRAVTTPLQAWCGYGCKDLEHHWANIFSCMSDVSSVPGFGCSDCRCESHLFAFRGRPDPQRFSIFAGMQPQIWPLQPVCQPLIRSTTITGSP